MAGSLEEIEAFVAVVAQGTFAAAATALGVSAPVVTRRVQALESRLATQLLRRTTRRVALTEAGRAFHARVGGIPAKVAEAEEVAREASARAEGQLRVIMPTFFASSGFHHEVIPRFLAAHPAVELTLRIVSEPLDHLREDFDLLVAARAAGQRVPESSLVRRRLLRFHEALFASPAYLAARGEPRRPKDLAAHNCLSYPERRWVFAHPETREALSVTVRGTLTSNSNAMLYAGVMNGVGLGYMSPYFFGSEEADGRVRRVMERYTRHAARDIDLFHPAARFRPRRARAFAEALVAHFGGRRSGAARQGGV
jgi:DNA-binding transcriptional LysR family regulator